MCTERKAIGYYVLAWFMFATMDLNNLVVDAGPNHLVRKCVYGDIHLYSIIFTVHVLTGIRDKSVSGVEP